MENIESTFKAAPPEIEVVYKSKQKANERRKITGSKDCYELFRDIFNADTIEWREEAIMLLLNKQNAILGWYKISAGGMAVAVMDVRMVFTILLKCCAHSIIIAHNHPSGNLNPSREDEAITQRIKKAGDIMEIKLLDHVIMTSEGYYSFADEGKL